MKASPSSLLFPKLPFRPFLFLSLLFSFLLIFSPPLPFLPLPFPFLALEVGSRKSSYRGANLARGPRGHSKVDDTLARNRRLGACFKRVFLAKETMTHLAGKRYRQKKQRWIPILQKFVFYARKSSYCFQRALAIAILSVRLSVRLSVCHTGGSVKNGASYDHQIFTVGCLEDSSFRNRKAFPYIRRESPRTRALNERGGGQNLRFLSNKSLYLSNGAR